MPHSPRLRTRADQFRARSPDGGQHGGAAPHVDTAAGLLDDDTDEGPADGAGACPVTASTIAQKFFQRCVELHMMSRRQDEAAPGAERGDPVEHLPAYFVGAAERQVYCSSMEPQKERFLPYSRLTRAGWR